jgi:hypothetical protein
VARRVVVDPVGLGNDADALGLQTQGDDLALEFVAGFLAREDRSRIPCAGVRAPSAPSSAIWAVGNAGLDESVDKAFQAIYLLMVLVRVHPFER